MALPCFNPLLIGRCLQTARAGVAVPLTDDIRFNPLLIGRCLQTLLEPQLAAVGLSFNPLLIGRCLQTGDPAKVTHYAQVFQPPTNREMPSDFVARGVISLDETTVSTPY